MNSHSNKPLSCRCSQGGHQLFSHPPLASEKLFKFIIIYKVNTRNAKVSLWCGSVFEASVTYIADILCARWGRDRLGNYPCLMNTKIRIWLKSTEMARQQVRDAPGELWAAQIYPQAFLKMFFFFLNQHSWLFWAENAACSQSLSQPLPQPLTRCFGAAERLQGRLSRWSGPSEHGAQSGAVVCLSCRQWSHPLWKVLRIIAASKASVKEPWISSCSVDPTKGDLGSILACCDSWGRRVGQDWATDLIWYPKRVNRNSTFDENKSPKWIHELSLVTITPNPGVIKTTNHWKMKPWLAIGREFEVQFQRSSLISQERERLGGPGRTRVWNSDISVPKPACSVWGSSAHGALRCCTKCVRILGECFYILV